MNYVIRGEGEMSLAKVGTVTDVDEIFYYFEILKGIDAGNILDAGMFLKRIGAVSRQVLGCEISAELSLYGIDFYPEEKMEVYYGIYDEILTKEEFFCHRKEFQTGKEIFFDIAVLLEAEASLTEAENTMLWEYAVSHAGAIMAGKESAGEQVRRGVITGYYPVTAGGATYAWIPLPELKGGC